MLLALQGINVCLVELEQHFITPMKASWEKMRQSPMLGYELGQVLILRGDARRLPLGRVDIICTSPPYEGSVDSQHDGIDWTKQADGRKKQEPHGVGGKPFAYTRPDLVITSPPYEEILSANHKSALGDVKAQGSSYETFQQPHNDQNIGNLRGQNYWTEISKVYIECHRCLKPGGLMVLVVKGFTRNGQYVDLPAQTQECCEGVGFHFVEQWERQLWGLSFWRTLQLKKGSFDERLRFEHVLAFQREHIPNEE